MATSESPQRFDPAELQTDPLTQHDPWAGGPRGTPQSYGPQRIVRGTAHDFVGQGQGVTSPEGMTGPTLPVLSDAVHASCVPQTIPFSQVSNSSWQCVSGEPWNAPSGTTVPKSGCGEHMASFPITSGPFALTPSGTSPHGTLHGCDGMSFGAHGPPGLSHGGFSGCPPSAPFGPGIPHHHPPVPHGCSCGCPGFPPPVYGCYPLEFGWAPWMWNGMPRMTMPMSSPPPGFSPFASPPPVAGSEGKSKAKPEGKPEDGKKKKKAEESSGETRVGRGAPGSGGGGGSTPPSSMDSSLTDDDSSADTSAIRSMLKRKVQHQLERPKSSLGSVKIEEFSGERFKYVKWKKAVEAQQQLYRLEEEELAMLVYLSTKREARDCLDQAPISEFTRPGGLRLVWRLLDEAFGESEEELFERAEKEYASYRRLPGQPVAAYIGQMKRLKAQYQRVDPETQISTRAWAQRLLNRCSLSRRERLDVFFSAGGQYDPVGIERALRHRCANTHEDERRLPTPSRSARPFRPRPSEDKKKIGLKRPFKRSFVADCEDPDGEGEDDEDLEAEEMLNEVLIEDQANEDPEELPPIEEGLDEGLDEDDPEEMEEQIMEAYAAGWKAKTKMNEKRKGRGWSQGSNRSSPGIPPSVAQKKQASHCASCGQKGHWRGDPQCPNVVSGKDRPHQKKTVTSNPPSGGNAIHFTYAVTTVKKKTRTEEVARQTSGPVGCASCPQCRWPSPMAARFCSQCGYKFSHDERMPEGKRGWTVVSHEDEEDEQVPSSESSRHEEKPKMYHLRKGLLKEAAGYEAVKKTKEKVKASPQEVMAALPKMTRDEKKEIQKILQREEREQAYESLRRSHLLPEYESSEDEHDPTASASGGYQTPIVPKMGTPKKELQHGNYMEEVRNKTMPKAVKDKKLAQFRLELYEKQMTRHGLKPSSCAPTPTEAQVRCKHPFERLRSSSNGDGHYATCKECGMKHVIYFSERHGAWMVHHPIAPEPEPASGVFLTLTPGMAIMDSGCRTAVAGRQWHESFQQQLRSLGLTWLEEPEEERFQFGSGGPEESTKAFIYPVRLHGKHDLIRMSCVGGGAANCPGLVGPSEMARWGIVMDFATKRLQIKGSWKPMILNETRHPAICLLDFGETTSFWDATEVQDTCKLLQRAPHSWAFKAEDISEASSEEDDEEPRSEESADETEVEEQKDDGRLVRALTRLEEDLKYMPLQERQEDDDSPEGSEWEMIEEPQSEQESETSHEFGVMINDEESEEESEDEDAKPVFVEKGVVRHLSKHQRSQMRHNVRELKEIQGLKEKDRKPKKACESLPARWRSKKGPWRVIELFTWTCMISLCAVQTGRWEMWEPISLPSWDLQRDDHQVEAHQYLARADPDLLVIAWPCTEWSMLNEYGRKDAEAWRRLGVRRQRARKLLKFVRKAARDQRRRGGALLGENPATSRAWQEPAIVEAFEGMPEVVTDMCCYGLKKPHEHTPEGQPLFLRKRTRLRGTEEILDRCDAKCQGGHQHTPVLGGVKIDGRWKPLSDFAGGYTKKFAEKVIQGAEEYLQRGRKQEVYVQEEDIPEERFEVQEDEMLEDQELEAQTKEEEMKLRKNDQLHMLHRRLGHPSNEVLSRMLRLAGADQVVGR